MMKGESNFCCIEKNVIVKTSVSSKRKGKVKGKVKSLFIYGDSNGKISSVHQVDSPRNQ